MVESVLLGQVDINAPPKNGKPNNTLALPDKSVKGIVLVNMSDPTNQHSPSQKAISAARIRVADYSSTSASSQSGVDNSDAAAANNTTNAAQMKDKLRMSLFSYIIDCWITISKT